MARLQAVLRVDEVASTAMTLSLADVRRLLTDADIDPKKSLGQNFVIDPNTVRRVARLSRVGPESRVVEIGAGLGSLTLALIETGARVTAIETDKALIPILTDLVGDHARIIEADVRNLKWEEVLPNPGWDLVANLPYNIATSTVLTVLDEVPSIDRMLVMVQREAGERLAASVGNSAYGAVSVRVALRANASVVGHVPPSVFYPRPRVTSALVAIERVDHGIEPKVETELIELLRIAFNQRRKMLRKSLRSRVDEEVMERANVAPTSRPEELDLSNWVALARSSIGTKR
ncbi:MAG: 16S rRNA (adenine(1518)-N(6)/adenine(1519)-N(6))-dimethyltransferase RsmA [Actinomycetota bacterium]|nr:16S rRNA (adenine(1518)-N(6)/adenine(1519)-N(6))-dimethyltransferase RsmA [Actinomycetota bacterium]